MAVIHKKTTNLLAPWSLAHHLLLLLLLCPTLRLRLSRLPAYAGCARFPAFMGVGVPSSISSSSISTRTDLGPLRLPRLAAGGATGAGAEGTGTSRERGAG